MKKLKGNVSGVLLWIFEIIVGILLLINPVGFTTGIITTAGIVMLVIGLISVTRYFRADAEEASTGQYLVKGLVAMTAGAFCAFKSQWFIATFPVPTIIYGVAILITGLGKVQLTVDMVRAKKRWFLSLISALVSIVCSVIILNNPFASTNVLWMFTGITLIAEAILDVAAMIINGNKESEEIE